MVNWQEIGQKIRSRRKEMGLSGKDLAKLIDRSEPMISMYENGEHITVPLLDRLGLVLNRPLSWFFETRHDPSQPEDNLIKEIKSVIDLSREEGKEEQIRQHLHDSIEYYKDSLLYRRTTRKGEKKH